MIISRKKLKVRIKLYCIKANPTFYFGYYYSNEKIKQITTENNVYNKTNSIMMTHNNAFCIAIMRICMTGKCA